MISADLEERAKDWERLHEQVTQIERLPLDLLAATGLCSTYWRRTKAFSQVHETIALFAVPSFAAGLAATHVFGAQEPLSEGSWIRDSPRCARL